MGGLLSPKSLGSLLPGGPCPTVVAGLEGVSWSAAVCFNFNMFKHRQTSLEIKYAGHPIEGDHFRGRHVRTIVMGHCRVIGRGIADAMCISTERAHRILQEALVILKREVRDGCHDCWLWAKSASKRTFLCSVWPCSKFAGPSASIHDHGWLVRSCVDLCNPESNQPSEQLTIPAESAQKKKKVKTVLFDRHLMASVFWDSQVIILINCLQNFKTVTGEHCVMLLNCLKKELKIKWAGFASEKGVLSPRRCSVLHVCHLNRKIAQI